VYTKMLPLTVMGMAFLVKYQMTCYVPVVANAVLKKLLLTAEEFDHGVFG